MFENKVVVCQINAEVQPRNEDLNVTNRDWNQHGYISIEFSFISWHLFLFLCIGEVDGVAHAISVPYEASLSQCTLS